MRPYRKEKVASAVRQIVGEAIAHKLNDPRVDPMTTVTRVEMTGDLLIARVFLSVTNDDATERRTLRAIQHAGGYIQRLVAGAVPLRHCPELRFEVDERVKGVRRTMEILAENRRLDPDLDADEETEPDADGDSTVGKQNDDDESDDRLRGDEQ